MKVHLVKEHPARFGIVRFKSSRERDRFGVAVISMAGINRHHPEICAQWPVADCAR
jgi:hypothetical protein